MWRQERLDSWDQFMCQWSRLVWSQDAAAAPQPADFPLLSMDTRPGPTLGTGDVGGRLERHCSPLLLSRREVAVGTSSVSVTRSGWWTTSPAHSGAPSRYYAQSAWEHNNRKKALCGIFLISNRKQQVSDSLFAGHVQFHAYYSSWRNSEGLVPKCFCCLPGGAPPLRIPRQDCGLPVCCWVTNASSISLDCNSMKWSV